MQQKHPLQDLLEPVITGLGYEVVRILTIGQKNPTLQIMIDRLDGKDITGQNPELISRAGVARTFQNIRLFNDMTVLDNVKVGLHNQIKYNMWTGILRLPAYREKEHEMNRQAKKLLKITVDDGSGTPRQIVSGIAPWYKPEELIGKTVVVVANLKPAKLCGEMSNGMLLAADTPDGGVKVAFLDGIAPGARLR